MSELCCLILGMHRSGTSCLARILHSAGLAMGENLMLDPELGNLIGHWESLDAVGINDRILARSGGQWDRIPENLLVEEGDHLAIDAFLKSFAGSPVYGWKDPRMTLTLPIWKPHLKDHRLLACFRHPYAVAQSLKERDCIPFETGLELWAAYNERLLTYAADDPQIFWFPYDGSGDEYWGTVRACCEHAGLRFHEGLRDLYNPCLTHYRGEGEISEPRIRRLHDRLLELTETSRRVVAIPALPASVDSRLAQLSEVLHGTYSVQQKDRQALGVLLQKVGSLEVNAAALRADDESLRSAVDRQDRSIAECRESVSALSQSVQHNEQSIVSLNQAMEGHAQSLASLQHAVRVCNASIASLDRTVEVIDRRSLRRGPPGSREWIPHRGAQDGLNGGVLPAEANELRAETFRITKAQTRNHGMEVPSQVEETGSIESRQGSRGRSPARYHCITPVWGAKYVARFVDVVLPSFLAEGNLPSLPPGKCLFQVYTRAADVPVLMQAASFRQLQKLVSVSIELIDDLPLHNAYAAMTACHRRAVHSAAGLDVALLFLLPDHVWATGSFVKMQEILESGKRAVMVAGVRVRAESAEAEFRRKYLNPTDMTLSITPRSLVDLLIRCFHPHTSAQCVDAKGNLTISRYYWDVNGHGLVARCCDLLPMAIWPVVSDAPIPTTLDHEYIRLSCPEYDMVHVVTDSDDICCVEVSDSLHHTLDQVDLRPVEQPRIVQWMNDWTNSYHREFLRTRILLHARDIDYSALDRDPEWTDILERSDELIERLMTAFHDSNSHLPDRGASLVGKCLNVAPPPPAPCVPRQNLYGRLREKVRGVALRIYRRLNSPIYGLLGSIDFRIRQMEHNTVRDNEIKALVLNSFRDSLCQSFEVGKALDEIVEELRSELASLRRELEMVRGGTGQNFSGEEIAGRIGDVHPACDREAA